MPTDLAVPRADEEMWNQLEQQEASCNGEEQPCAMGGHSRSLQMSTVFDGPSTMTTC